MQKFLVFILAALAPFVAVAQPTPPPTYTVTLSWTPPTQNTNGTALTNLASYRVYWSTTNGTWTQANSVSVPSPATGRVLSQQNLLSDTTYFFTVTAVNTTGQESPYPNVASKRTPVAPTIPGGPSTVTVDIVLTAG